MLTGIRSVVLALLLLALALAGCTATSTAQPQSVSPIASPTLPPTPPAVSNEEGGEGGVEAALVTYADAQQGFAIGYPSPWTQDTSVTTGVKFVGGDDSLTLEFVPPPAGSDAMAYAKRDLSAVASAFPGFKQVGLAASTEVKGAVVLGFTANGTSAVTGKAFSARGDRYYMPLADGRMAVLTVLGPDNHYDREGVRDIALTFRATK